MLKQFRSKTPQVDKSAFVAENATLIGSVTVGANSSIWFGAVVRGDSNSITIGARTSVQDLCVFHVDFNCPMTIGNDVTVGHRATIHGATIKDRVLVGMGSIVMNGAVIGEDSIIGAGAIVTENTVVPPGSLILGVPAKVKRAVTDEEKERILLSAKHYAEFAGEYLKDGSSRPKACAKLARPGSSRL